MSQRISVIIPVHGRVPLLLETLAAVYGQEGDFDKQVILIDDCSPEPIEPEVRRHFPDVTVIRNPVNVRPAAARNQGLDIATGEYVAMLDSDDLWDPRFLADLVAAIRRERAVAAVALSRPLFSAGFRGLQKARIVALCLVRDAFQWAFYMLNRRALPRSAFYLCQLSHVVFSADALAGMRLDPGYFPDDDWHLVLRVGGRGHIAIVPRRLVRYRYHSGQQSADSAALAEAWGRNRRLAADARRAGVRGPMLALFHLYNAGGEWIDRRIGRW